MGRKVLITGGAGFIGSHLVECCLARGYSVVVIDDLSVGRLKNLSQHSECARLTFVNADVADYDRIALHFRDVEWVFHLAARADIVPSIQYPMLYHRANVDGTVSVLEAARAHKVKRFIYSASSSCYGVPDRFPTPETAPLKPQYPYALTKMLGEQCVLHWNKVYGLSVLSLRFFNVYGPRVRTSGTYGAVFGVFLAQRRLGKPLTIVGDGTQTRDFTYVSDVVSALLLAAESNLSGDVYNVGSGGTYSVNRLAELIGGETVRIPKRPGEPDCTFADISKVKRDLGWSPRVTLEEGVRNLMTCLDEWADAPLWSPQTIAEATADWFRYLGDR